MSKTEWKSIRVTKEVYECLLRSKALMEIQTGTRYSMNDAINGLLEYAPILEGVPIEDARDPS